MKKILAILVVCIIMISLFNGNAVSALAIADAKISDNLNAAFAESATSSTMACVTLSDADHLAIMEQFRLLYPIEYEAYMLAKSSELNDTTSDISDDILQSAIEHKRALYQQYYAESNQAILESYVDSDEIVFVSSYAPFAIIETTNSTAFRMAQSSDVLALDAYSNTTIEPQVAEITYGDSSFTFVDIYEGINLSNQISRADYVRDTYGNSGSGVKIGMVEVSGVPDTTNSFLGGATINIRSGDTTVSGHATVVATIMVGKTQSGTKIGVAPDATLYACITPNTTELYAGLEWLINSGVNVINTSLGSNFTGDYSDISEWIDHIAVTHDVHVVIASGNTGAKVSEQGMSYNAITVGAFNANSSTSLSAFTIPGFSSYIEDTSSGPEKPNLIANGVFIQPIAGDTTYPYGFAGTSFSAPQVTGVIAQLCSYNSALKYKQTVVGAILAASSVCKVNAVGSGSTGDSFAVSSRVNGNAQISDVEGAGILDAYNARQIAASGNYWSPTVYAASFPYTKSVYISSSSTVRRIAIFWLKQNTLSSHTDATQATVSGNAMANLNLYVYDPNGNLVAASVASASNFEIVQFIPTVSGNYQIKITGTSEVKEYIGIALW